VCRDRSLGDGEQARRLGGGKPLRREDEHLLLALGELLRGSLVRDQRDGGVEVEDAARRVRDGLTQLVERSGLQNEPLGPGAHRRHHVLLGAVGGEHEDVGRQLPLHDALGDLNAAAVGHLNVEQRKVGLRFKQHRPRGLSVRGLSDELDALLGLQPGREAGACERMVVGEQYSQHLGVPLSKAAFRGMRRGVKILSL